MGYFDALTSACFKTAADGRRLFFPWASIGGGYVIPSEQEYERLRGQVRTSLIVPMVLIIGIVIVGWPLWALAVAALLAAAQAFWMWHLRRGFEPSNERLSIRESAATQARTHSAAGLWAMEIGALLFVAIGIAMLFGDPGNRLIALGSIVLFGLCAAKIAHMLIVRRRAQ